jgi:hypothetical protein
MSDAPTINLNLEYCAMCANGEHEPEQSARCPGKPLPIPCPLPPSVTFRVVVGQCPSCGAARPWPHQPECRTPDSLKPISVSCSISGETWAESSVVDIEWFHDMEEPSAEMTARIVAACRDRWALGARQGAGDRAHRSISAAHWSQGAGVARPARRRLLRALRDGAHRSCHA